MMVRRLRARPAVQSPGAVRVVIGVDFDEPSLATARWLARHVAPDAELVLVHVLPVPRAPAFLGGQLRSPDLFVRQVAPAMRGGLQGLASTLGAARTRVEVRVGEPAEQLAAVALEVEADLVCVGHPRPGRRGARSGRNTVERLARRLTVPLLQGAPEMARPALLLAAVDGGPQSDPILTAAWALASRLGARLDAVHVLDEDVRAYARAMAVAMGDAPGAAAAEAALGHAASDWLRDRLESAGARSGHEHAWVRQGSPGAELLATVAPESAVAASPGPTGDGADEGSGLADHPRPTPDIIVVGREGRDALKPGLVGGTTRLLLSSAVVPVLVVPAGEPAPSPPDGLEVLRSHHRWPPLRRLGDPVALVDSGAAGDDDDGGLPPAARGVAVVTPRPMWRLAGRPA